MDAANQQPQGRLDEPEAGPVVAYERDVDETTAEAVVAAVSSATGTPTTEMDPIYDRVDPDALDALFRHVDGKDPGRADRHVVFHYESRRVRVNADGRVLVY